jgi:hypothetical protein
MKNYLSTPNLSNKVLLLSKKWAIGNGDTPYPLLSSGNTKNLFPILLTGK